MSPLIEQMLINMAPPVIGIAALVLTANFIIYKVKLARHAVELEELEQKNNHWKSSSVRNSPMANPVLKSELAKEFAVNLKVVRDGNKLVNINDGSLTRSAKVAATEELTRDYLGVAVDQYRQEFAENEGAEIEVESPYETAYESLQDDEYHEDKNEFEGLKMSLTYGRFEDAQNSPEAFAAYKADMARMNELAYKHGW